MPDDTRWRDGTGLSRIVMTFDLVSRGADIQCFLSRGWGSGTHAAGVPVQAAGDSGQPDSLVWGHGAGALKDQVSQAGADVGALEEFLATGRGADRGIAGGHRGVADARCFDQCLAENLASVGGGQFISSMRMQIILNRTLEPF
jgi:hypothetical protein